MVIPYRRFWGVPQVPGGWVDSGRSHETSNTTLGFHSLKAAHSCQGEIHGLKGKITILLHLFFHLNWAQWEVMYMMYVLKWQTVYALTTRARINSWIELELIINSIQFSMNWIGIELKDFELEMKAWNDRNWSIQSIHFQFNSPFYKVKHFFACHIMEIVV